MHATRRYHAGGTLDGSYTLFLPSLLKRPSSTRPCTNTYSRLTSAFSTSVVASTRHNSHDILTYSTHSASQPRENEYCKPTHPSPNPSSGATCTLSALPLAAQNTKTISALTWSNEAVRATNISRRGRGWCRRRKGCSGTGGH